MNSIGDQQPPTIASKKYACKNCGYPYEAAPPDDVFKIARLEPCKKGDSKAQNYECQNCHEINILHWDKVHGWVKPIQDPREFRY